MLDVIARWVAHYGYALVALFLLVEGAGVPVPGETALVTAAAFAGRGTMSLTGVILSGIVGTFSGCFAGYWIGASGGVRFLERHGRWIGFNEERLARTRTFFAQHGAKTVLLGRFIAFLRSFVGIFAGISRMSVTRFAAYNLLGGSVWVGVFSALGYLFGRNLPRLVHFIGRASLLVAIVIAVAAAAFIGWRWFSRNRESAVGAINAHWKRLVTSRFAWEEYLALHLIVGFVVSLVVIGVFASITEGVIGGSPLTRFDVVVAARLAASAGEDLLQSFSIISDVGARGVMTLLFVAGGIYCLPRRRRLELTVWCIAFVGGSLLDAALRFAVRRNERAGAELLFAVPGARELLSAHTLGVVVGYGMAAYLLYAAARKATTRTAIVIVAAALVALITLARLYLGQQYVSDASAGLAAGLIWLVACISGLEIARQYERPGTSVLPAA